MNALRNPENLAQAFASMQIMRTSTSYVSWRVASIPRDIRDFAQTLERIEKLYEANNIKNKVIDGAESFKCDENGLSIEFR